MSDKDPVLSQDDIDSLLSEAAVGTDGEVDQADSGQDDERGALADAAMVDAIESEEPVDEQERDARWASADESKLKGHAQPAPQRSLAGTSAGSSIADRGIEFILDIPLQLRVEVGRTRVSLGDLLSYGPGAVVPLDKVAGEPLEIFVNDKLVARGEAVIVNEKFGVRLTEVVSKAERIEHLG